MRHWPFAALLLAAIAITWFLWPREKASQTTAQAASTPGASATIPSAFPSSHLPVQSSLSDAGPHVDRAKADEMREKLRALLAEAGPAWNGDTNGSPAPRASSRTLHRNPDGTYQSMPEPDSDAGAAAMRAYIRDRVHDDFFPLAQKCYENELAQNPKLAGRIVVKFTIAGDKRIGGVVDKAEIGDESTIALGSFRQCMSESMMSVTFDAPPSSGQVSVHYPFEFSPDDEEDAGDSARP